MHKVALQALLLIFYVLLMIGEINNSEFEETFNNNVSEDLYTDFDNDGEFDFDSESDEESSELGLKISHAPISPPHVKEVLLSTSKSSNTMYRELSSQDFLSRIFMPPKA